ncbi:MAG: dihydroorotase [Lachnospiraceae bacterium]|nr:dihydroorotase [Lachnospiraceae bacterium]
MSLIIKNGRIMDPVTGINETADITIADGRILKIGPAAGTPADRVIDAEGMIVAPGLMDAHVHFRDPGQTYKEDIFTGCRAAARGGFTRVLCMANTKPPVDTPETLRYCLERGRQTGIRMEQAACLTAGMRGKELTDMDQLAAAGAAAFTDDGVPVMDEKLLLQAMRIAKRLDMTISLHEEDPLFIKGAGVNKGEVSKQLGYGGADAAAEDVLVARDCMLALHTGARICIQHISSANSVEIVRAAKKLGADVHAEATPHHFTLTEKAVLVYGTNARMNPPLRTERDRLAVIEGLRDGTIDMIVTDHAPHSRQEKEQPIAQAPSGIIGLETSLGLAIRSLVEPGYLSMMEVLRLMSTNPALLYRMEPASVREKAPADLVIFRRSEEWTADSFVSKAANSPFAGWKLPGRIHYTICGGNIVWED